MDRFFRSIVRSLKFSVGRSRKFLIDEAILIVVCFFSALIIHYIWANNFSGACLEKQYSTFRDDYLEYVFTSENVSTVLDNAIDNVGSDLVQVYLYTSDYKYVIEYASSNVGDNRVVRNLALMPIENDLLLEAQYDDHRFQQCHVSDNGNISNIRMRNILGNDSTTEVLVSCPLIDRNNFVTGYVAAFYTNSSGEFEEVGEVFDAEDLNIPIVEQNLRIYSSTVGQLIEYSEDV